MFAEYTAEEIAAAIDDLVAGVLDKARCLRPPIDAFAIARTLGLQIARDDRQQGRARFIRLSVGRAWPVGAILLKDDPRPERLQWAVAHEIGESLAERAFEALGLDPRVAGPRAREQAANSLAGRLLVPSAWLRALGGECDWELPPLKRCFATASHELIARRALEESPPAILSIFDQGRLQVRAWSRPGRAPPLTAAEAACQRCVHQSAARHEAQAEGRRIRGWPVHEPAWQREILRLDLPEYDVDI